MAEEGALPVQDLAFNITDTEVVLSEISHSVEILFVISAYNCRGTGAQASLIIYHSKLAMNA